MMTRREDGRHAEGRRPERIQDLAERYRLSRRQVSRATRVAASPTGRLLLRYLRPRTAERLLEAVRDGLMPLDALTLVRPAALRLLRHWRAGQLPAARPVRRSSRPPAPQDPEVWMLDPELVAAFARLAQRRCPGLRIQIGLLLADLRRTLGLGRPRGRGAALPR